jgi:hypothetical protein
VVPVVEAGPKETEVWSDLHAMGGLPKWPDRHGVLAMFSLHLPISARLLVQAIVRILPNEVEIERVLLV